MVLIDQVESGVEDKKLCGSVYGPASQEKECVHRPKGLWLGDKIFQDDPNGIDDTAPGSKEHGPVVYALLFLKDPVNADIDIDKDEKDYGDEATRC